MHPQRLLDKSRAIYRKAVQYRAAARRVTELEGACVAQAAQLQRVQRESKRVPMYQVRHWSESGRPVVLEACA